MHNSDQVRDFFQKMASGLVLNIPKGLEDERVNGLRDEFRNTAKQVDRVGDLSDFGVGLPPLAHG